MDEKATLARPYAVAVFKLAAERKALGPWSEMLGFLSAVMRDPLMRAVVSDPRIERSQLADLVLEIAAQRLDEQGANLVRVLAHNARLALVPEIAQQFEQERARAERRETVQVTSAYKLTEKFQGAITKAMERRLGCDVDLATDIDRALIGGVVIRAGDLVIDASLRGRLHKLGTRIG